MYKINWFTILSQFFVFFFVILKTETWHFVLHLRDFVLGDFVRGILSGYRPAEMCGSGP